MSKLFKRNSLPTNEGNSPSSQQKKSKDAKSIELDPSTQEESSAYDIVHGYVKVFELVLSNMEETPIYTLDSELTIGSEIGNIIISDSSISPRHATFLLQNEVISLIDHGSIAGSFVNGKKIPSGKQIILEESDTVLVGDLEIRINVGRAAVKQQTQEDKTTKQEIQDNVKAPSEKSAQEKTKSTPEVYVPKSKPQNSPVTKPAEVSPPKTTLLEKQKLRVTSRPSAANALERVLALIGDLLVSYAVVIILAPFDDFKDVVSQIPEALLKHSPVDLSLLWQQIEQDYGAITVFINDLFRFIGQTFDFVPTLTIFVSLRLLSVFVFGVSLSQFFLGIRPLGNPIWARLGGALRGVIGLVSWPFLIFDAPCILSKRTFKEVITFTQLESRSKFMTAIGILFYLPLVIFTVLLAPLFQGLESPEQIPITKTLEKRIRLKKTAPQGEETLPKTPPLSAHSESLNLSYSYNADELTLIPDFNFKSVENKLNVRSSVIFYQRELQRFVELEILKTFDLKELLSIGLKGNFFLQNKYPQLTNFVHAPIEGSTPFKTTLDTEELSAFSEEFIKFSQTVFSLSPETVMEVMQNETPLIQGLMNFRSSFLDLIEYKEFDNIGFIKLGNLTFMKISFIKQKPFDLLIPLLPDQGKILKVSFENKDTLSLVSSKLYKFNLENANWTPDPGQAIDKNITPLSVFDIFSSDEYKALFQTPNLAQSLYGLYFEQSASLLQKGDPVELALWKSKISQLLGLVEALTPENMEEGEEEIKLKLVQNLRDLLDALENNNFEYFGLSTTAAV